MAERMVAYCGIVCSDCPAFIGTQTNNQELLAETARKWSTSEWQIKPEDIVCDGCISGKRLAKFCYECPTAQCGKKQEVKNCGWCDEYPCKVLLEHWERFNLPDQRKNLDEERKKAAGG